MSEKKAPKLHELLAALGDIEAKSKLVQNEASETFTKRISAIIHLTTPILTVGYKLT